MKRVPFSIKLILVTISCSLFVNVYANNEKPVAIWASYPVGQGDNIIVHGGNWGKNTKIEIGGKILPSTPLSDTGLVFPYPSNKEEIFEGRIVNENGASRPFSVNIPTPWWIQGDAGDTSTPGGTLRVFGRSLAHYEKNSNSKPRIKLGAYELALEKYDVWSLDARIPTNFPEGEYPVKISNGLPGGKDWYDAGTWRIAKKKIIWKDKVFNILDYGAIPNDDLPDTIAFENALENAKKNNGGIVYVPAGRFIIKDTLTLPPYTLLKGEDRSLSQICWPDTMNPPTNLIQGSHSFAIHDLFISSGLYRNGIVAETQASKMNTLDSMRANATHDISLKRLRIKLVSDQWRDEQNLKNFLPRYSLRGDGIVIRNCLRGEIEDCVIYCDKDAQRTLFFNFTGEYIRMANCRINGSGWAIFGGDKCIFENNSANNCTYSISSICRRMFWSKNTQTDLFTNNREAVTHDGAKTAFKAINRGSQGCASGKVNGTSVKLTYPENISWKSGTNFNAWVNHELQITDGRGAGQTRTIKSMKSYKELEIDRPYDIEPDETSLFVIVAERKHLIYVDNDIEDAGVAIQLYGGATDCVVARNRSRRAGGFHGSGRDYHGIITCWFIQFLGNVIEEGNCHRGNLGTDWRGSGSSIIGAFPPNVRWPFSQTYVYRDNEIKSNGSLFISVKNALVEKNKVSYSSVGISSRRYQNTMYISSNTFDRVEIPYMDVYDAKIFPPVNDHKDFIKLLKEGKFDIRKRGNIHRAFAPDFITQSWNINLRNAVYGRMRNTFKLPITLKFNGMLTEDIRSVSISIPSSGGWDFGGELKLKKRDNDKYDGKVSITPPKEGPVGMFTWNVNAKIKGEGWECTIPIIVNPLTANRFLVWEASLSEPNQAPKSWKKLAWYEGMDGHESIFPEKIYGDECKGKDFRIRTKIEVFKATQFIFTRGDWTCEVYIDGKQVLYSGANTIAAIDAYLKPGIHTIEIFRSAKTNLRRKPNEGMFLYCTFPFGCPAGNWVQR
jgi:hypothetical protein